MCWWFAWLQFPFACEVLSAEDIVPLGATCICAFSFASCERVPGWDRLYWSVTRARWRRLRIWDGVLDPLQYDFTLFHNIIAFSLRSVPEEILDIEDNWVALAAFRALQRLYPGEYDDDDDDIWGSDF